MFACPQARVDPRRRQIRRIQPARGRRQRAVEPFLKARRAAWINSRLWTRKHPQPDLIVDNVWLGRIPAAREQGSFKAIVDLCAELPINPQGRAYACVPVLDLIAPTPAECLQAAQAIERLRASGPLLVCCALGYSRSATAVAAWLLQSGRATTVDEALAIIRTARAHVVLHPAHREALEGLAHAR